ncbi:hypothetical protein LC087_17950 [Bacillus carboniphilus]|uniref:Uncharacterized protein n=1 Tax=Bacillus carboniphilus TaxID=86663 RepID=A0ABY9JT34_9BACI|nr:hypothetical protein [Bacillus carboniphilus]WLR42546.1 hypothetical protein LC087_17950 [Bacillus carboniphilus]
MVETSSIFELGEQRVAELVIYINIASDRVCFLPYGQLVNKTITYTGYKEIREQIQKEATVEMSRRSVTV